ncbi:MAG: serine/threonine protein kinase [Fuerstiella sp.]|nr:serine/threonine protein kinase [Fuerstiella sp.]
MNAVSSEDAARETRALLDVQSGSSSTELSFRFDEGTRQLLRKRLFIVGVCLIAVMTVLAVSMALNIGLMPGSIWFRTLAIAVLAALICFVRFGTQISVASLRRIELLVVAVPIIEMVVLQTFRTEFQLRLGAPETIPAIRATVAIVACLMIAMYGIFIPSTWQRTAVVGCCVALLPTIAALIHIWLEPQLRLYGAFNYAITTLSLSMAALATLGSHLVSELRRDVEAARQYGQYRLTEEIGRGGMGVVYRGEHRLLKRPAAIKLIQPESAADEIAVARFEQEVQLSATLTHWNTVRIFDYGRTDHGDFYCVMELLEGSTLRNQLRSHKRLSVHETLRITQQLCDGLQEAHGKGMVHRDLKPANVFLAETGGLSQVVKILDFGVATTTSSSDSPDSTQLIGTPYYMSPEQIRGEITDGTCDIYSVGCLMFECVTGSPPFTARSVKDVLSCHLNNDPPIDLLPESPPGLRALVRKCMDKEPVRRFATAAQLGDACRRLADETSVSHTVFS